MPPTNNKLLHDLLSSYAKKPDIKGAGELDTILRENLGTGFDNIYSQRDAREYIYHYYPPKNINSEGAEQAQNAGEVLQHSPEMSSTLNIYAFLRLGHTMMVPSGKEAEQVNGQDPAQLKDGTWELDYQDPVLIHTIKLDDETYMLALKEEDLERLRQDLGNFKEPNVFQRLGDWFMKFFGGRNEACEQWEQLLEMRPSVEQNLQKMQTALNMMRSQNFSEETRERKDPTQFFETDIDEITMYREKSPEIALNEVYMQESAKQLETEYLEQAENEQRKQQLEEHRMQEQQKLQGNPKSKFNLNMNTTYAQFREMMRETKDCRAISLISRYNVTSKDITLDDVINRALSTPVDEIMLKIEQSDDWEAAFNQDKKTIISLIRNLEEYVRDNVDGNLITMAAQADDYDNRIEFLFILDDFATDAPDKYKKSISKESSVNDFSKNPYIQDELLFTNSNEGKVRSDFNPYM